jgi:hypothetical protein
LLLTEETVGNTQQDGGSSLDIHSFDPLHQEFIGSIDVDIVGIIMIAKRRPKLDVAVTTRTWTVKITKQTRAYFVSYREI